MGNCCDGCSGSVEERNMFTVVKKQMKDNYEPFHAPSLMSMRCFILFHHDDYRDRHNYLTVVRGEPQWSTCNGSDDPSMEKQLTPHQVLIEAALEVTPDLETKTSKEWADTMIMSWEDISSHRHFIKATTRGEDLGILCVLRSSELETMSEVMKEDQNSFSCTTWPAEFVGDGRSMVLRDFGLFCFRKEKCKTSLAYIPMVKSIQYMGPSDVARNRMISTHKGDVAMYVKRDNEWTLASVSEGPAGNTEIEAYLKEGLWTGDTGKLVETPVMVCDQFGVKFASGDTMKEDHMESIRDLSSENMVYKTPTYMEHQHTLFKHCRSLTLFAESADGTEIDQLWSQKSPGPGKSVELATAWFGWKDSCDL